MQCGVIRPLMLVRASYFFKLELCSICLTYFNVLVISEHGIWLYQFNSKIYF